MQIIESLQSLGLNEKEAKVYTALLQLGRASAYSVAEKSGLKKPTAYVILGDLIEKGLVFKVPRLRKQLFAARSPDEFFAMAEERLSLAKKVLPELMAMAGGETTRVRSIFYEGLRGMRQSLWYRLKEMKRGEIVGFYATAENASEELKRLFFEWNDEIVKRKMRIRGITPLHPSLEPWEKYYRLPGWNFKFVPFDHYSANISIDVGDTFVRILMFRDLQSVIVENTDVARTVRQIFEMLWSCLPDTAARNS
jgi:hypothetical protein